MPFNAARDVPRPTKLLSLLAVVAATLALVLGVAVPAQAANTDTVSGVATRGSIPTEGIHLNLYRTSSPAGYVGMATSAADGTYSFADLPHGTYRVFVYQTPDFPGMTTGVFTLSATNTSQVANVVISPYPSGTSSVTGTITDVATGSPIEGASVRFAGDGQAASSTVETDASGAYAFIKLPGGAFSISVSAPDYLGTQRSFVLTDGGTSVQDFSIGLSNSTLTGYVIDDVTGDPILGPGMFGPPGGGVSVTKVGDESFRFNYSLDDVSGLFESMPLSAGEYSVSFGGPGSDWQKSSATVTVLDGETASVTLHTTSRSASYITGKVTAVGTATGLARICVDVYDDATKEVVSGAFSTPSTGIYKTGDLDPGTYDLLFWDCSDSSGGPTAARNPAYSTTFLGGSSWIGGIAPANKIVVTAGQTVSGINMALKVGASISGHINVAAPGGTAEFSGGRGMDASIYQFVGGHWELFPDPSSFVGFGGVGDYIANGLPAGTYRVGFSDQGAANTRAYAAQYWPATSSVDTATSIVVSAGQKKTGVNASVRIPRPGDDPTAVGTGDLTPLEEDVIDAADTAAPGSTLSIDVGVSHAGEWVSVWGHSTPTPMGTWSQVDKSGTVTVTVPTTLVPGDHDLVVQNASDGVLGWADLALAGGPYPSDGPGSVTAAMDAVSNTLSATLDGWPMGTGFAYQWFRGATASAPGTAIAGASASAYTLTPADAGQFVKLRLTATVPGYAPAQRFSTATNYTLAAAAAPTISGQAAVGQSLHANPATYTAYDGAVTPDFSYQWLRNGAVVSGAVSGDFVLSTADVGKAISVRVVASAPGHLPVTTTSAVTQLIGSSTSSLTGWDAQATVTVTQSGSVLTAAGDGVTATGVTRTYQWFRGGVAVAGATKATYTLAAADAGKAVHVVVTIKKPTFTTIVKASVPADYSIVPSGPNSITGVAKVGKTLSITPVTYSSPKDGALTPTLAYAWYRNGAVIAGANSSSYTLVAADLSTKITARVTASLPGYVTQAGALTVPTAAVAKGEFSGTLAAPVVAVSPTGVLSASLSAGTIDAAPAPAFTLGYQWYRSGVVAPVSTAATYTLSQADAGKTVSLKLTVNKAGYTSAVLPQTAGVDYSISADGAGTIPSSAKVGDTLTVVLPNYTTKDGALSPTLAYAWLRNGAVIAGATGSSYAVQSVDFGTKLSVRITATSPGFIAKTITTPASASVAKGVLEVNNLAPLVSVAANGLLTADLAPGTTDMPAPVLAYKWLRGGAAIAGATARTYQLSAADAGKLISVAVTVSKANTTGGPFTLTSDGKNYTLDAAVPAAIEVTGTARVGAVFSVSVPEYTVGGTPIGTPTRTYQWLRNNVAIAGATSATYTAGATDYNTRLSVRVSAVASSTPFVTTTTTTAALAKGVFDGSYAVPVVTLAQSTLTLTAALPAGSITTPSPVLTYQWYKWGTTPIAGATKSTYKISAADYVNLGGTTYLQPLSVRITVTRPNFLTQALDSSPVSYGINAADDLVVSGDVIIGSTLTAAPRTFSVGGVTESYQWLRDGAAVSGATASTYVLSSADLGKAVSVRVTATADGYVPLVTTSAALPKLAANTLAGSTAQANATVSVAPATRTIAGLSTGITEAGTTVTYQWFNDSTAIAGAKSASYKLREADIGYTVWVRVTTSKASYTTNLKDSARANYDIPAGVTSPTLDVTAPAVGDTLTASTPVMTIGAAQYTPSAAELTYEWIADEWFTIQGATSSTYVVEPAYEGKSIMVKVTLTVPGMPLQSRQSAPTAHVTGPAV